MVMPDTSTCCLGLRFFTTRRGPSHCVSPSAHDCILFCARSIKSAAKCDWVCHICRPRQVGDITEASLLRYGGRDPSLPLCFAIRGKVLDVSEGRDFYGPGQA